MGRVQAFCPSTPPPPPNRYTVSIYAKCKCIQCITLLQIKGVYNVVYCTMFILCPIALYCVPNRFMPIQIFRIFFVSIKYFMSRTPIKICKNRKTVNNLTINVPLFKKLRDIIFFCGTITFWPPQNVPRNGSKSYCPKTKKIMSQSFLNSGTLVILCLFATMGPHLCPAVS
jgi:hypothetical protein